MRLRTGKPPFYGELATVDEEQKPILDYSSPAQERAHAQTPEDERRQAIERYNESTFGERRPIASAFFRIAVAGGVASLTILFLPRDIGRPAVCLTVVGFAVWEFKKNGWRPRNPLRRPFWWWW